MPNSYFENGLTNSLRHIRTLLDVTHNTAATRERGFKSGNGSKTTLLCRMFLVKSIFCDIELKFVFTDVLGSKRPILAT